MSIINRQDAKTFIGDRSFGEEPSVVAAGNGLPAILIFGLCRLWRRFVERFSG